MPFLYNILTYITSFIIPILALVKPKLKLFYKGRKETFTKLSNAISPHDKTIWIHCASLGEFEQGRPVIEKLKIKYPNFKIIVSFFSPSGYEVRKNYELADVVVYLPLDTPKNAQQFIKLTHPSLAIFVKYEFWPNILKELKRENIPTLLISGIFRKEQAFFRKKGEWYRNSLAAFTHFFVQNEESKQLLQSIGYNNTNVSGDTRFDRVYDLIKQKKELPLVQIFTQDSHVLVAGSTWQKDETLLVDYINNHASNTEKFIIAPHNIYDKDIQKLTNSIKLKTVLYSNANKQNIQNSQVLIIDSIGLLTNIYNYADIAYVGGGFGTGIHNILEPATYGLPILIGPNYHKFKEANDLINRKACVSIRNNEDVTEQLSFLNKNKEKTTDMGTISATYIKENTGATQKILEYVNKVL